MTASASESTPRALDRRRFMAYCSAAGLGGAVPATLWAQAEQEGTVTTSMLATAEEVIGLEFSDEERELMLQGLNRNLNSYRALREHDIPNSVAPAVSFDPVLPGMALPTERRPFRYTRPVGVTRPANLEALAFESVTVLSELIRTKQVTSTDRPGQLSGTAARDSLGGQRLAQRARVPHDVGRETLRTPANG
jgi:hypothetical protein